MTSPADFSGSVESKIATALARISTAMRSQAWSRALAEGITPTQADILALLHSRGTPLRLSIIAEQLAISPATASDSVSTLVSKGMVEKIKAHDDRRAISLSLSRKGQEVAANFANAAQFLSMSLETLHPSDKTELLALLVKLIKAMQDRGDIPAMRMCVTCDYYRPNDDKDSGLPHYCNLVKAPFSDEALRIDCPEHRDRTQKFISIKQTA